MGSFKNRKHRLVSANPMGNHKERSFFSSSRDTESLFFAGKGVQLKPMDDSIDSEAPASTYAESQDGKTIETHYGTFEATHYHSVRQVSDRKPVGVMMYLKFHPGQNTDARKIGLTQVAQGKIDGKQVDQGMYGDRSGNEGPGKGHFIDTLENYPNPVYAAQSLPLPGKDPSELSSYDTDQATPSGMTEYEGVTYQHSGGENGYHFHEEKDSPKLDEHTKPAELYDHPLRDDLPNNSEQTFESAAIAIEGNDEGTYYGSVEWGYKKDESGNFSLLPFNLKSETVPSVSFFTAVKVWNDIQIPKYIAGIETSLIAPNGLYIGQLNKKTTLNIEGESINKKTGEKFYLVTVKEGTFKDKGGYVKSNDVITIPQDTVDLPIVQTFKVSSEVSVIDNTKKIKTNLPAGTRVRVIDKSFSFEYPGMYKIEVLNGPFTGLEAFISANYLLKEALGGKI